MNRTRCHRPVTPSPSRTGVWLVYSRRGEDTLRPVVHLVEGGTTAVVGAGSRADLRLDDRFVSRRHFRVGWYGAAPLIEDLSSTNGTVVTGRPVPGRAQVETPAIVRAGRSRLTVLDAVRLPGGPGVSLGALVGPAEGLVAVLHRALLVSLEESDEGRFQRLCLRALLLGQTHFAGPPEGMLRLLAPELALGGRDAGGDPGRVEVLGQGDEVLAGQAPQVL